MTRPGPALCLSMIVKNEAHVIRRCLASVRPVVDHWIVVDTGSTDGTQDIVREAMAGIPGEVVERPWVDFGHNRSEALALARPHGDYALVIDADDELVIPSGFVMPELSADSYVVDVVSGQTAYQRTQVMKSSREWRYRGVLHEFPDCPQAVTSGHLPLLVRSNREGARSRDGATYARDAAVLARALEREPDPFLVSRYTFYLAQSYRDCGEREKAATAYLRRAELGFWDEERYVSLYQAGLLLASLGRDADSVLDIWRRASLLRPGRAEAAHASARLCRTLNRHAQACAVAEAALTLRPPPDGLFVETWIYDYGLCDEYAVSAYWAGRYAESLDATLKALEGGKVPAEALPRLVANARFAFDAMRR